VIGEVIGSYRLLRLVGQGGMGAVYAAEHQVLGKQVAIKVLLPRIEGSADALKRFMNEARAAALVRHPGIVQVHELGERPGGGAYIVMDLLDGETLRRRLSRDQRLAPPVAAAVALQVASAVGAAHLRGIVHRDLKPDNLFLEDDSAVPVGARIKVLDFGIAKLAPGLTLEKIMTSSGQIVGTPLYMAPEQLRSANHADARSDIYSLGCVLYEMVCGRPPFNQTSAAEVIMAHLSLGYPRPRTLAREIPEELEAVICRALEKDPAQRFVSMEQVSTALASLAAQAAAMPGALRRPPPDVTLDLGKSSTLHSPDGQVRSAPAIRSQTSDKGAAGLASTLGSAAGEASRPSAASTPPGRTAARSWLQYAAGGAVVIAVGLSGGYLVQSRLDAAGGSGAGGPRASRAGGAVPAPAAAAVQPGPVTQTILSEPSGADVLRYVDGVLLGQTPYRQSGDRSTGRAVFVLKLAGHRDRRVEVPLDRDHQAKVELVPLAAADAGTAPPASPLSAADAGSSAADAGNTTALSTPATPPPAARTRRTRRAASGRTPAPSTTPARVGDQAVDPFAR
jgi:serine/threonine-protein kinase